MTINELARLAGVSPSTVSKVMNHKDSSISPNTRDRILQIAKEHNYIPYSGALSGPRKTFLLGMISSETDTGTLTDGVLDEAQKQGYLVTAARTCQNEKLEEKAIQAMCRNKVDAVLWQPVSKNSLNRQKTFHSHDIPFLTLPSLTLPGTCQIDFERLGSAAADALLRLGHRSIAFLASDELLSPKLLKGYKSALFDMGIPFQEQLVFRKIDDYLLARIASGAFSGIAAASHADAAQLYEILLRRHYVVPRDLSIITFADSHEAASLPSQIAYVGIPGYDFGRHMTKNLISFLERGAEPVPFREEAVLYQSASLCPPFSFRKKHMTVIGSINIDNYMTVNKLPITGMTSLASNFALHPGGKAVNIAIGVSRLGAEASVIGAIGNDLDSSLILSSLEEHSIAFDGILLCPDTATGKAFIFVQPDGNSTISILVGANNRLGAEDILRRKNAFENCSCCLMQTEVPQAALIEAAKLARERGAMTILKPSACTYLEPELLKYIDIIVPNRNELGILSRGRSLEEQTAEFLDAGVSAVIITFGKDGCLLKTRDRQLQFPAMEFTSVDNTGAGDAFISALAVYLQDGYSMEDAIRIATYAAGFCVSREGVALSMIDRNTLESHINKKEPGLIQN